MQVCTVFYLVNCNYTDARQTLNGLKRK